MIKEELIKIATPLGNSSHIILPKDWEGYEVKVIKKEIDPKKEIIQSLEPNLNSIIGVYLYGSYARKEQNKNSDIDVIIITDKKINLQFKKPLDIIQIEKDKIGEMKRINPVLFYSFLSEAKPLINEFFLKNLKEREFKDFKKDFKEYIKDTEKAISINRKLLELDKISKQMYVDENMIYSLMLRLRGIYIIENLIKKEKFSNDSFLKNLRNNLAHNPEIYYEAYSAVRDNKKFVNKITTEEAEKLLNLLNDMVLKLDGK